jgi:hypothetical protein
MERQARINLQNWLQMAGLVIQLVDDITNNGIKPNSCYFEYKEFVFANNIIKGVIASSPSNLIKIYNARDISNSKLLLGSVIYDVNNGDSMAINFSQIIKRESLRLSSLKLDNIIIN